MAPTSGQHHSLIKQGITGLHRDSHYRPLEESSGGCLFVSQSSHCTVLNGLHVAVGHEAALIKSIPFPFSLYKDSFSPKCHLLWRAVVKIYSYTSSSVHVANIPLLILEMIVTKQFGFKLPWQYSRPVQRSIDHILKALSETKGWLKLSFQRHCGICLCFPTWCWILSRGEKIHQYPALLCITNPHSYRGRFSLSQRLVILMSLIAILNYPPTNCNPNTTLFFFLSTSCWINKSWRDKSKQCISRGQKLEREVHAWLMSMHPATSHSALVTTITTSFSCHITAHEQLGLLHTIERE